MRVSASGIIATLLAEAVVAPLVWLLVVPRMDWSARQKPPPVEQALATNVLTRWIRRNAVSRTNPLSPTPDNLKEAQAEYEEHCAACHGLDGGGSNRFEAQFYPPVAKLTGGVRKLSDSDIYFIVANGIRYTAMPAFEGTHSPDDIWRMVLWVRHLTYLTADERAAIVSDMRSRMRDHGETMQHGPSADANTE